MRIYRVRWSHGQACYTDLESARRMMRLLYGDPRAILEWL